VVPAALKGEDESLINIHLEQQIRWDAMTDVAEHASKLGSEQADEEHASQLHAAPKQGQEVTWEEYQAMTSRIARPSCNAWRAFNEHQRKLAVKQTPAAINTAAEKQQSVPSVELNPVAGPIPSHITKNEEKDVDPIPPRSPT